MADDAGKLRIVPAAERDKQEVDENIVALLKRYLEEAESGELNWVGIVAVDNTDYARWSTSAATMKTHEVVGRIEQLKFHFLHE